MTEKRLKIGVVATGSRLEDFVPERVAAVAKRIFPENAPEIFYHPASFRTHGHFAGDDDARSQAFLDIANDPAFDALWFARGGYGSNRVAVKIEGKLAPAAKQKLFLGYSDAGFLLAYLYKSGCTVAHGPVASDVKRYNGEIAIERALRYIASRDPDTLEPSLDARPHAAFNLTILSQMLGTPFQPDLAGHVLMIEDVSEYMYRIDRMLFHLTENRDIQKIAGLKLGRFSDVPENDPPFILTEEEIAQSWCANAGIAYLGRADIGHDWRNKVVPFGLL